MRELVIISVLCCFAGCLAAPEPSGNLDTTEDDLNADAGTRDGGDPDGECASCKVGDTQCALDDQDRPIYQKCEDEFPGCNIWVTLETCVGDQACDSNLGCQCPTSECELGEYVACPADGQTGAFTCVLIDGCPKKVDVGQSEGCGTPIAIPAGAPSCDDPDAGDPWYCRPCENGRGCEVTCDNTRGYTCGVLPGPE